MASRADVGGGSEGFTALFVRRPILAVVLNGMIVTAGLGALLGMEVRELPDVDRPVITVTTELDGAAPETIDREITAVIEGAMGRISGVEAISSRSSQGRSRVTVEFSEATDLNVAAADSRDSIGRVLNQLPDDADDPRIVKADANSEPVMRIGVTSSAMSIESLTELVENRVVDRLIAVPGVADVQTYGARERIFRIDVDQMALASRGLTVADVRAALDDVAFDQPAGSLEAANQSLVVRTTATVNTPEAFGALMVDEETRLSDVALVTLGPDIGNSILRSNGENGLGLGIIRQAQSNSLDISDGVAVAVAGLARELPEGVRIFVTGDDAVFIRGAIHEVLVTLALAVAIVVGIIGLFLRDWRATLIPAVTIPVALIGTLALIYVLGFSLNILTLLALVLATGLVVDDAIVVLENIVRRRAQGMGPRAAAVLGTRQVFFAVVATTATLAAVFVPLSFLPGQAGGLFREFGITLGLAVTISAVVALSLCPMLASRMLDGPQPKARAGPLVRFGGWLERVYHRLLHACLGAPLVVATVLLCFGLTSWMLYGGLKREITPPEDRASVSLRVSGPQGASLEYLAAKLREIEDRTAALRDSGEVVGLVSNAGAFGQRNAGFMIFTLAGWDERGRGQAELVADIERAAGEVIGIRAFAATNNSLGIRGAGQGLQFAITGSSFEALGPASQALAARMEQDAAFRQVRLSYETTQPQLFIEVDRERASDLGIDIDGLGETLQAVLDGRSVGSVFIDDRSYDIKLASSTDPVRDPADLEGLFLATRSGEMVPMSSVVTLDERPIAPELGRESQMRSVTVSATLGDGTTIATAFRRAEALAAPLLAPGMRLVPLAEAAALDETAGSLALTFGFAVLIVAMVLAAQFESFVSALIIMAVVPFGLGCAVVAMVLAGVSLNVYSQIGLVLLVGVIAKNGILVVEFANQLRDRGAGVREAIEEACRIRLRPVMMTMAATILGGVPLLLSGGAGAEARHALGWVIVGGLGLAVLLTLFVTPVAYLALAGLSRPRAEEAARLERELAEVGTARTPPLLPGPAE
ncbi:MAG TPA: efflux RND transporter permease subunit [Amaricoccus sp.]|nr:efflux RND transporter permease subunit [Amaricoccus sp.]